MSPRFSALLLVAAGAGTLGIAAPAMAKTAEPSANEIRMTVMRGKSETLYCVTDAPQSGTRIPTRLCQDRAHWAREGIVIPLAQAAKDSTAPAARG